MSAVAEVVISREELQAVHAACKAMRPQPGSEAFSLMSSAAAVLNQWPRVKPQKAREIRERFARLSRPAVPPVAPVASRSVPVVPRAVAVPAAVAAFLKGLSDLPDGTAVIALVGAERPTGLTLGDLRRWAGSGVEATHERSR